MLEGAELLWGDTVNANINRYIERYFVSTLKAYGIPYDWDKSANKISLGGGYTDFRSADIPQNWEGFSYDIIFLNEAGIILNKQGLYYNSVLPMLIDSPDSRLIAAGTPKMINGKGRVFYDLYKNVLNNMPNYVGNTFDSYQNPFIDQKSINILRDEMPTLVQRQEIYGEFIVDAGNLCKLNWFKRYERAPEAFIAIIQSWDTANKDKVTSDYSCCTTWGETFTDHYLLDVFRDQLDYPDLRSHVKARAEMFNPDTILIEDKASGQQIIQELSRDTTLPIISIIPEKDKVTRFLACTGLIESGNVSIPSSAPWLSEYEFELASFPAPGFHDDQVDSTSQALNFIRKKRLQTAAASFKTKIMDSGCYGLI